MTARHHSHLSSAGLLRRQFLAAPVASILLALLVLADDRCEWCRAVIARPASGRGARRGGAPNAPRVR